MEAATETPSCPYCGGEGVSLFEAWDLLAGEFMLDACCERAQDEALADWSDPARLNAWDVGELLGSPVRAVHQDPGATVLDCRLQLGPISQAEARRFITAHHRHCPAPVGWKFGIAARNAGRLVGVAWVGRPVARRLDTGAVLEVNRLCTIDGPLAKQAASMLYGASAREAKRRGATRIVTYTLEDEAGTSLRAAGWTPEATSRGGSRSRKGRPRAEHATGPKLRWGRDLR